MNTLFEIGVTNAVLASVLAVGVWLVTRIWRHPALVHALWVLVLVKLVTPPMVAVPWHWPQAASAPSRPISPPRVVTDLGRTDDVALGQTDSHALLADAVAANTPNQGASSPGRDGRAIYAQDQFSAANNTSDASPIAAKVAAADLAFDLSAASTVPFSWTFAAGWLWLGGSTAWLCIALFRVLSFQRALRHADPAPVGLQHLADNVAARLGVSRYRLRITAGRLAPLVWPVSRPTVLLSQPLVAELSPAELRTLLAHEFAHLRRRDHWIRWLELAVTTVYWWHPVAWWARAMIHQSEERACDAWAVWAFPDDARRYATALFKAAQFASTRRQAAPAVASQLSAGRDLHERIENIMNATWNDRLSLPVRLAVLFVALVVLPFSLRAAQQADTNPTHLSQDSTQDPKSTADDRAPQAQPTDQASQLIRPGMVLHFEIPGAPSDQRAAATVGPDSSVSVVLPNGGHRTLYVAGLTVAQAEVAIPRKLQSNSTNRMDDQVESAGVPTSGFPAKSSTATGITDSQPVPTIQPNRPINIAIQSDRESSSNGIYQVDDNGDVDLGPRYGRIHLAGLTDAEATAALIKHLETKVSNPKVTVLGAGKAPVRATASQPPAGEASDEVKVLRDQVKFLQDHVRGVTALFDQGLQGGSRDVLETANYELARAQSELSLAEGSREQAIATLERARDHAEQAHNAVMERYRAGTVTQEALLQSSRSLVDVQRELIRIRGLKPAPAAATSSTSSVDLDRMPASLASNQARPESLRVLAKIVETKQAEIEYEEKLAAKGMIGVGELRTKQAELEISKQRLDQAQRAMQSQRLLVELARNEYEQAVEANKKNPGSVSELQLRRLLLLVQLAESKLDEAR